MIAKDPPHFESLVLHEDNHLLVINKPAGLLVQGDNTGDEPLVEMGKKWLGYKYDKPGNVFLGVVHRLDRPTSGALVFAKTSKALSRLNAQFANKQTQKTYWAMVGGQKPEHEKKLIHYLIRNAKQNKSYAYEKEIPNSKLGVLTYKLITALDRYALIEITLETGRHHQIRAQLAQQGLWIKGDLKYGAPRSNANGGIDLHARQLTLIHPTTKEQMTFVAPTPKMGVWKDISG